MGSRGGAHSQSTSSHEASRVSGTSAEQLQPKGASSPTNQGRGDPHRAGQGRNSKGPTVVRFRIMLEANNLTTGDLVSCSGSPCYLMNMYTPNGSFYNAKARYKNVTK